MTTETSALERYNHLFDNPQYSTIAALIAADLHAERDSLAVSDTMNMISDAALGLVDHPSYVDAWLKLAIFCSQNAIAISTVDAIYRYLLIFQQPHDTRAEDFECTAKALLKAYETTTALGAAVSYANGVHGWRGRMAYELMAAADYLTQAALHLLMHGDLSYIREKLQSGLRRITGALYEGVRHSERPGLFDFSSTCFPKEDNGHRP